MKKLSVVLLLATLAGVALGFANGQDESKKPIVFVWYPNESGEELSGARGEIAKLITGATGRPVEHKLTTDYAIAIETVVNKNAHLGFWGAQGYIEAHNKNPKVLPLAVNSGASGTLQDAVYYSWLAVKLGNEGRYKASAGFSIDNIQGKKMSFVSNSSTSGFKVPSAGIVSYFSKKPEWSKLTQADLLEGGYFFSEVLYGGSHQGSAVNLLTGRADVAAFCDTCVFNYVQFVSGTENRPGAIYKVKDQADEPFNNLPGERFVLISVTPVLNAPFVYNGDILKKDEVRKILAAFTAEATAANEQIFIPKGSSFKGLFKKGERFLAIEDSWFNPIRELSK